MSAPHVQSVNLSRASIQRYWNGANPELSKLIQAMEWVEEWVLDDDDSVEEAIGALGIKLAQSSSRSIEGNGDLFIDTMAYMSIGRVMRTLEWINHRYGDDAAVSIIEQALDRDDKNDQLMLDRIRTILRMSLLSAIFSRECARALVDAIRSAG